MFQMIDVQVSGSRVTRTLGWEAFALQDAPHVFALPETTVGIVARHIKQKLGASTLRLIGDPDMSVTTVGLQPGFVGFTRNRQLSGGTTSN